MEGNAEAWNDLRGILLSSRHRCHAGLAHKLGVMEWKDVEQGLGKGCLIADPNPAQVPLSFTVHR